MVVGETRNRDEEQRHREGFGEERRISLFATRGMQKAWGSQVEIPASEVKGERPGLEVKVGCFSFSTHYLLKGSEAMSVKIIV